MTRPLLRSITPGVEIPSASGRPWEAPAWSITSLIISRICTPTARLPSLVVGRLQVADRLAEQVGGGDADVGAADVGAEHEARALGARRRRRACGRAGPGACRRRAPDRPARAATTAAETVGLERLVAVAISGRVIGPSRKIVSSTACSPSSRSMPSRESERLPIPPARPRLVTRRLAPWLGSFTNVFARLTPKNRDCMFIRASFLQKLRTPARRRGGEHGVGPVAH